MNQLVGMLSPNLHTVAAADKTTFVRGAGRLKRRARVP
jgi:hypothetical protein